MTNDKKKHPYGIWRNLTKEELKQIEEKKMANDEKNQLKLTWASSLR